MKSKQSILSFNAGELTPDLNSRVDLDKYKFGCRTLQNALISIYGSAERRAGFQYIAETKDSSKKSRLIHFQFSRTQTYILELGDYYMRFYVNGAQIESGGSPYELITPWAEAELFNIKFAQINDVMYLTSGFTAIHKLIRISDTSWTLSVFDASAYLTQNLSSITLTASAYTGSGITITASSALFNIEHVGSIWKISHKIPAQTLSHNINANGNSSSIQLKGAWSFETQGIWNATVSLERLNGTVWEVIKTYSSVSDRNISVSGEQSEIAWFRITVSGYVSNTGARAVLEAGASTAGGSFKITGYTSSTSVTADVLITINSLAATTLWCEGAWSLYRGYPKSVTFFENRLWFAGTEYEPQTFWASAVGDYEVFDLGTLDTSPISYPIAALEYNAIEWMMSSRQLIVGTSGGEWIISGSSVNEVITATNILVRRNSNYGSSKIQPVFVDNTVIFAQRQGLKLREMGFSFQDDRYIARDLNSLANHVTSGGIVDMAYQQQPDSRVWVVTGDGVLATLTIEREQNVFGWQRQVTSGNFESVSSIYGSSDDQVWCIVKRTINGGTKRYVERLNPNSWTDINDAFYVDSGITYDGASTTSITGLSHLEGETVSILADGSVVADAVVSSGAITLATAASKVHTGLSFATEIRPMRLDTDPRFGITQGNVKRIRELVVRVTNCISLLYNNDIVDKEYSFGSSLFTGDKTISIAGDYGLEGNFSIKQTKPLPLSLQSVVVKYEVT